jgi:hypothetical protein
VVREFLRGFLEHQGELPFLVGPHLGPWKPLGIADGSSHHFTCQCCIRQNLLLSFGRLKSFAFLNAKRLQHPKDDAISFESWFSVDHLG